MDLELQRVIAAMPSANCDPQSALARLDPEAVASVATDVSLHWWRRRFCAKSLCGRVQGHAVPALWNRIVDSSEIAPVRIALLEALCSWWTSEDSDASREHRASSLDWLRAQTEIKSLKPWNLSLIVVRCQLGDLSCTEALAEAAYSPWRGNREAAMKGLDYLCNARSEGAVLDRFSVGSVDELVTCGGTPAARYLGVVMLKVAEEFDRLALRTALGDEDVAVAHAANDLLEQSSIADDDLVQIFDDNVEELRNSGTSAPPLVGRAAAACRALTLFGKRCYQSPNSGDASGDEARREVFHNRLVALGPVAVSLPGIPQDIRKAVLQEYLPGERTTDPRFLLEGLAWANETREFDAELPQKAYEALVAVGVDADRHVPIGEHRGQGAGSYSVVSFGGIELSVCNYGPFVTASAPVGVEIEVALIEAGFRWVDGQLSGRSFDGLPVYFFGYRDPLTVGDLLFYWQD